jgi:type I restriction enzyme S subunit
MGTIEIKISPHAEQKRIVAKIEELFGLLDEGVENLKKAQQQLKVYRQAVLKWAFEGRLTSESRRSLRIRSATGGPGEAGEIASGLPEGWRCVKLGEICSTTSGGTPSRKNPNFFNGNIPWVKSGELENNTINDTEEKITEDALKNSSAKIFPKGTILIALYGATIGKLALLGINAATNQAICGIFEGKNIASKFLFHFLSFKRIELIKKAIGGAQPNISQSILRDLLIALPSSLDEQILIIAEIESRLSVCDKTEEIIKNSLQQAEGLRQSILKRAFEGRLVAQDPDDEPASVLLERIRGERGKNDLENKKNKKYRG